MSSTKLVMDVGMREIYPNNFGNNDRAKELRFILEFWCNFKAQLA